MFTVHWICSCQVTCLHWDWETPKKRVIKTRVIKCLHINDAHSQKIYANKNTWNFEGGFKRLRSLRVAHMVTNSALYSSSHLSENEHHNYITNLDQQLMTCLWFVGVSSFQQIIHQCCTDLSTTCVSISSLWLSTQQGCQGLVQAPEPHLKLGKPGRRALQGCEPWQEEEHHNWLAVSEKVFSMPTLSALKQDYFFSSTAIT